MCPSDFEHESHGRTARQRRDFVPKEAKQVLYDNQAGRCMYCGRKSNFGNMVTDHIKPVNRQGANSIENIQLLCVACDSHKGRMTDTEFRRKYNLPDAKDADHHPPDQALDRHYFENITNRRTAARKSKRDMAKMRSRGESGVHKSQTS